MNIRFYFVPLDIELIDRAVFLKLGITISSRLLQNR
jgi:hypothetical protein